MSKATAGLVLLALALTGCSAVTPDPAGPSASAGDVETLTAPDAPSATPMPDPVSESTVEPATAEDEFLADAHLRLSYDETDDFSDEELLAFGEQVCEEMAAGETHPMVVPGSDNISVHQSRTIWISAGSLLCPELRSS